MGGFLGGGAPEAPAYVPPTPAPPPPPAPAPTANTKLELSSAGSADLKRKRAPTANTAPRNLLGTSDGSSSNTSLLGS